MIFLIVNYFEGTLVFHEVNLYNVVDNNWRGVGGPGGGGDTNSMTIFFELLNIVYENDFLRKISKNYFGPIRLFSFTITISLSIIIK